MRSWSRLLTLEGASRQGPKAPDRPFPAVSGRLHPAQQVVNRPRVDHPLERHLALGGPVAAVRLPLELAGGVGVGVDRELAAVVDRQLEQLAAAGRGARAGS